MAYTLAQLRQELAKTLDSFVTGTATGGSTTTIIDTDLLDSGQYADDHFNGADLYMYDTTDDAAPEGEARYCTDFVQSTGTLTVGKEFTAAVGAGDTYEIYLSCTVAELNQALMFSVKDWRLYTTLTLSDNTAEYTVSADHLNEATQITGVWMKDSDETEESYHEITNYNLWDDAGTITIEFQDTQDQDSSYTVRIEYLADFSQLKSSGVYSDTASVGGDLSTHILYARKYYFERKMVSASGVDREFFASMVRYTGEEIELLDEEHDRRPSKVKLQDYGSKTGYRRFQSDWWI